MRRLLALADDLVRKRVWIIGGDGWAYDIGFGGLDHVLASGSNVNILVLDTGVYSNTGGQASKATPRGAVAKFATSGKGTPKKDLGALGDGLRQRLRRAGRHGRQRHPDRQGLLEADAWPGPSLVIAYCTCIGSRHRHVEVDGTHEERGAKRLLAVVPVPPTPAESGQPFKLDSREPSMPVREFAASEARFAILSRTHPERSERLLELMPEGRGRTLALL